MDWGRGANPRDGKCHRNKPPVSRRLVRSDAGKGEKAGQEPTGAVQRVQGKPSSEQGQIGDRRAARPASSARETQDSGLAA